MISIFAAVVASVSTYGLGRVLLPEEPIIVIGSALALGFLTRKIIDTNRRRNRQEQADDADIFPFLKRNALEKWSAKWGHEFEHLKKVVIFDPPLKYPLDVAYVLYFDFDTSTPEGKKCQDKFNEINAYRNNDILDAGFEDVYQNKPTPGFRFEWFVTIVKYAGFNANYSWVIYQKD
jgi:hypothetical protein